MQSNPPSFFSWLLDFVSNFWKAFSTPRLLNTFPHLLDGDLEAASQEKQRQQGRLVGKACCRGRPSRGWVTAWDLNCDLRGRQQNRSHQIASFSRVIPPATTNPPKIPWSSLTENGCPHSIGGSATPSLSKASINNILLSDRDQVTHLGRWHTWADRPPHPSCAQ